MKIKAIELQFNYPLNTFTIMKAEVVMIDKKLLYQAWHDLACQHYRANNATMFLICLRNAARIKIMYLHI